jgi:hypothetical protein
MKKLTMALMATTVMVTSIAPVANAQEAPSYLEGIDAAPMTLDEMDSVRGEAVPAVIVAMVARRVGIALGAWAGVKIADMLQQRRMPTAADYRAEFGSNAATVIRLLPSYLRPNIAR